MNNYTRHIIVLICALLGCNSDTSAQDDTLTKRFHTGLQIEGDFNGDGEFESLTFQLTSKITEEEINHVNYLNSDKSYKESYCLLSPQLKLTSATLNSITLSDTCGVIGPMQLLSLGDLNNDGGEEIAIMLEWEHDSEMTSFQVYTYERKRWILVNSFPYYISKRHGNTFNIEPLLQGDFG